MPFSETQTSLMQDDANIQFRYLEVIFGEIDRLCDACKSPRKR
jgi:hypothetical protein